MYTTIFWVIVFWVSNLPNPGLAQNSSYCEISTQHTLCQFQGIGPSCKKVLNRGVNNSSRETILQTHNLLRSKIASGSEKRGNPGPQPTASNMLLMEWDDELAVIAQRWADQCNFQHDCSNCRQVRRFVVGQNLYTEGTSAPILAINWKKAITDWYNEVALFPNQTVSKYQFSMATGHYTQIAWAQTNKVGCGLTTYQNGIFTNNFYVCNYGPSGNFIGLPMYQIGRPCSQCPANTVCSAQFPKLCGTAKKQGGTANLGNTIPGTTKKTDIINGRITDMNKSVPKPNPPLQESLIKPSSPIDLKESYFVCNLGTDCRASYRGSAWSFQPGFPSSLFDVPQGYLETMIHPEKTTELLIDDTFPAPSKDLLCLTVKLRYMGHRDGKLQELKNQLPSPIVIMIKPTSSQPAVISLQPKTLNSWIMIHLTLRGIKDTFHVSFRQEGFQNNENMLHLSLQKIYVKNGSC